MTPITLHIEYLLQRTDCLVLPGLGALIARAVPASFDMQKGIVTPPSREFSFNPAIRHDDGTLATSIARREQVKFEEGRLMMQQAIADITTILRNEGEFNIGRIGMLTLTGNSAINFIPFASRRKSGSELGMKTLNLRELSAETEMKTASGSDSRSMPSVAGSADAHSADSTRSDSEEMRSESIMENTHISEDSAPEMPDTRPGYTMRAFSDKNYYIPINKILAKCAASVAAVFVVAFILLSPVINPSHEQVTASMNPMESIAAAKKTTHNIPQQESIASGSGLRDIPSANSSASDASGDTTPTSYLIVATFSSQKEAEAFVEARSGGSYELQPIKGKNVWRVAAGQGDQATLRALLNSEEFRAAFSEAWIWSQGR